MTIAVTGSVIVLCFAIRRHYLRVQGKLRGLEEILSALPGSPHRHGAGVHHGGATAVLFVGGYGGLGVHALLTLQRLFPDHFRTVVFVSVGVIDAAVMRGVEEVDRVRRGTEEGLRRYVELAERLGLEAVSRHRIGTEVVSVGADLALEIAREFPGAIYFMGNLVFEKERWFGRILHNDTAYRLQRRLQFAGLNAMVLPVRVREREAASSGVPAAPREPRPLAVPAVAMLLAAAVAGCGQEGSAVDASRLRAVEGVWTITARLERPARLTLAAEETPPISGELALIVASSRASAVPGLSGPPTHYGVFSCDFTPFGFDLASDPPQPSALARLAGDSIELVLGAGDRAVQMAGRFAGDSISGAWWRPPGRAVGLAMGSFVLRRSPP